MKTAFTIKMWVSCHFVLYWILVVKCLCTAWGLSFITKWPSGNQYTNNGSAARQVLKIANEYHPWAMVILAEWETVYFYWFIMHIQLWLHFGI